MSYTKKLTWETIRTQDTSVANFNTQYFAVGSPFVHPSYICKLVNNSNVLVTISIDGSTDVDVAPANSFWLYDEGKLGIGGGATPSLPVGTQIYVKGSAIGSGLIYLVTQYIISL